MSSNSVAVLDPYCSPRHDTDTQKPTVIPEKKTRNPIIITDTTAFQTVVTRACSEEDSIAIYKQSSQANASCFHVDATVRDAHISASSTGINSTVEEVNPRA